MTARITISMPDDLEARINSQLDYGDNRSELIRELIERGLDDMEGDGCETTGHGRDAAKPSPEPTGDEVVLGSDLPSHIEPDDAREAIRAALSQIDGGASKDEIVRTVMPEHALGYDVNAALAKLDTTGDRYRGAWWRRVIKPGLEANGAAYDQRVGWAAADE